MSKHALSGEKSDVEHPRRGGVRRVIATDLLRPGDLERGPRAHTRLPAMYWSFGAACTIVAGSLFLVMGTGAQAWFQIIEYEDVLETAKDVSAGILEDLFKGGTRLLHVGRGWFAFRGIGLYSAALLIGGNMDRIRVAGKDEDVKLKNAARLRELLHVAVPWYLLLTGSYFVLAGALIQLALAWP
jgi:hypothetical protein